MFSIVFIFPEVYNVYCGEFLASENIKYVERFGVSMNWKSSSSFSLKMAPASNELEKLQFISAIFGEWLPNAQFYWKNSSSAPLFGQKRENEREKFRLSRKYPFLSLK